MWSAEKVGAVGSPWTAAAIPAYPELRRFAPELRSAPIFSRPDSHSERSQIMSRFVNCTKLNRQTHEFKFLVTRRKQTPALRSNRQNFHFRITKNFAVPDNRSQLSFVVAREHALSLHPKWFRRATQFFHAFSKKSTRLDRPFRAGRRSFRVNPNGIHPERICEGRAFASARNPRSINVDFRPFLTGSAPQTELAVTHSKQTTAPFLTGSRTAIKRIDNEFPRSAVRRPLRAAAPRNTGRGPRIAASAQAPSQRLPSPPSQAYVRLIASSMPRGKFVVLEGIDGSGKRTQLDMLARAFASRNVP